MGDQRRETSGARTARWVIRWRWAVLAGALGSVALSATGLGRLSFTNRARVWFGAGNPEVAALDRLEAVYGKSDNVLFVVEALGGEVFETEVLAAIERLTDAAWRLPFAARVDGLTNYQHVRSDGDELVVSDLLRHAADAPPVAIAAAREVALSENALVGRLISEDASVTAVNVTLRLPGESLDEVPEVMAAARALAADIEEATEGVRVRITGTAALNNAFSEAAKQDFGTLIPLMYLVVLVLTGMLLRSTAATVITGTVIAFSIVTALGVSGWLGITLNPASVSAPTIILTLAVADSVHLLAIAFDAMRRGASKVEALVESLRVNAMPVLLTSATTSIGFLSLNFSDAPPFRDLGNVTALGVLAALVYSVLLVPALMSLVKVRVPRARSATGERADRVAAWAMAGGRPLLLGGVGLTLVLAVFGVRSELDDRFVQYFDEDLAFRADTEFTQERLTGIYRIEYSVDADGPGGVTDPSYLRTLDDFAHWFEAQPGVTHVASFSETIKRLNRSMHGDEEGYYSVPADRELASQYLLLYELSLPYGLDLTDRIDLDRAATRFVVTLGDVSAVRMRQLAQAGEEWLRSNAPSYMSAQAAGNSLMFANISKRNIDGMLWGTLLAFLLVSLVLLVSLRSVSLGLLSLVPNLVPAVAALGIWGATVGRINMGMVVVVAISMGIVVDDTVHLLSKYRRGRQELGLEPEEAVRYAFRTVGEALVFTSGVLGAGFAVLTLSSFEVNASMGLLTALTIALALAADALLLPPLLVMFETRPRTVRALEGAACFALALGVTSPGALRGQETPQARGLAIAEEADRTASGFGDFTAGLTMVLRNGRGDESNREMRIRGLEVEGDGDRTLIIFDSPGDVRGTALLSWAHGGESDDQWLFLPALRRVKRIASDNKSGPFMGSEFAYEDISAQEVGKYTYRYLRDESVDGVTSRVVERIPTDDRSGYSRQEAWYDEEYRLVRVDYFDRRGALLKTLSLREYGLHAGRFWRAARMEMTNHQNGKSTVLLWADFAMGTGLSQRDFDQSALRRAR